MEPDLIPQWLDKDFIQSTLRENENGGVIIVKDIDVRPAVGKGENYSSQLHRVSVNLTKAGKPEQRSLVVKSLPTSEFMLRFVKDGGIFEKETKMYQESLPAMYQLLENKSPNSRTTLSCRCYTTTRPHTIVLDDLKQSGYRMAMRHDGLDLRHATLAIRAMARLHALSIGLMDKDPNSFDAYAESMYVPEKREMMMQMVGATMDNLAMFVEKWDGYERFGDKLRSIGWVDRTIKFFNNDNRLAVLNHGDSWVNNMMFKYSETGQVEDMKFVDYQMCRYASPAIDIHYFLYTSPCEEVRIKHWDTLLREYHEEFVAVLKEIGSDPDVLSLEALKKEVEDKMLFGLMTACSILPVVLASTDEAPDLDQIKEGESLDAEELSKAFSKTYDGERFRDVFGRMLLYFESIDIL